MGYHGLLWVGLWLGLLRGALLRVLVGWDQQRYVQLFLKHRHSRNHRFIQELHMLAHHFSLMHLRFLKNQRASRSLLRQVYLGVFLLHFFESSFWMEV